jgi:flagellar motor switch protein FliG
MAKAERLTGVQKAAVLLISLGPEVSANIVKKLPQHDIEKITLEIANTTKIRSDTRDSVLEEFVNLNKAKEYVLDGGIEYAKTLLSKALGVQKAMEIMEQVGEITQQYMPFGIARKADPQQLLSLIMNEHPQTIALILCYLQSEKAAQVLCSLPPEVQRDVSKRIASMKSTSPAVVHEIEKVIEKKLSTGARPDLENIGGINTLVQVLNMVDRDTKNGIIEFFDEVDSSLAENIRASLFSFEDIVYLDDSTIQKIIRQVNTRDLALAIKGSSKHIGELIFKNMSKKAGAMLQDDIEDLGPVRVFEIDKAKQNIVSVIRSLDEAGEIIISRGGQDAIVT